MKTTQLDSPVSGWTYGAELELSDLDQRKGLPKGFGWDKRDVTMVNSNGIAVDPHGKLYPFGGEINTPPTKTIKEQVLKFKEVLKFHSDATVNHRSNLHIHVRVPGLKKNLEACKKIQRYVFENAGYLDVIEPIPRPDRTDYKTEEQFAGANRRYNRRKVSHHASITKKRFEEQQAAKNFAEFFAAEAPKKKDGTPMFHLAPRLAVNLRQLQETDTIEFRHFPGTLDAAEFKDCLRWCRDFLIEALGAQTPCKKLFQKGDYNFPKFAKYVHWREVLYRNTVHDGTLKKDVIAANIKKIRKGEWSKKNLPADPSIKPSKSKNPRKVATDDTSTITVDKVGKKLSDYKKGTPTVTFIRGTSGSGKSTLIYNLLLNDLGFKPVEQKNPTIRKDHKYGYVSKQLKCFIVGSYHTPAGGCDAIPETDEVLKRIKVATGKGFHVIAEGLILSGLRTKLEKVAETNPVIAEVLSTPTKVCLERVQKRRDARGDSRPLNPENTILKARSVVSSTNAALPSMVEVKVETNDEAFRSILKRLGCKSIPKFEPNIFAKRGHKLAVVKANRK